MSTAVKLEPLSSEQLIGSYARELILLAGKDGVGKSSAIVSMARKVEMHQSTAKFYVIDTEHKFPSALRSFGADAPHNIEYWPVDDMNTATYALRKILKEHKPGDWLAVESMARMWERAQNLAYEAIAGVSKVEYLEAKLNTEFWNKDGVKVTKKASPVPRPDDFWAIAKGSHDAAFVDLITNCSDLNVVATTTIKPPPRQDGGWKESRERAQLKVELGIDVGFNGTPSLPYYFETLCMLELEGGKVSCRVLRDNNSQREQTRPTFEVPSRKDWALMFYGECR